MDDSLPFILNIFLANLLGVLGPLVVTVYALPWFCLVLVPLCLLYWRVQARYRPASRDLKRLSSVSLSPIYSHFSETLAGLSTIRALRCGCGNEVTNQCCPIIIEMPNEKRLSVLF